MFSAKTGNKTVRGLIFENFELKNVRNMWGIKLYSLHQVRQ